MQNPTTAPTQTELVEQDESLTCACCGDDVQDLQPWDCCGEIDSCAGCVDYNDQCDTCARWEDATGSRSTW